MSKLIVRAKLAGRLLRFVPFIKMAALNGSIVRGEENKASDIDILIVCKKGRLYTCRAFATILIHLTGWRRHGKKTEGRICLNCYLSENSLNIIPEQKKSISKVVRAYKYMIPLVDDGVSQKFFKHNRWFSRHKVNGGEHSRLLTQTVFKNFPLRPKKFLENMLLGRYGDLLEKRFMTFQVRKILNGRQKGDEIFVSKSAIKLHPKKY